MIHILKIGKTINFVEFDEQEFIQMLKFNGICQDAPDQYTHDKWLWEHRYMFLTFRGFNTLDEAQEFINNSVTIQEEIREENLVYSNLAFKYFSAN